uniref:Uncharacterized protein n=1 Tax=Meloidogyne enterolobii TaxID=390850 RepID=A0A6V7X2W6_MELEN|nr:unnamed protein product [Meloidogyne enterolobii]
MLINLFLSSLFIIATFPDYTENVNLLTRTYDEIISLKDTLFYTCNANEENILTALEGKYKMLYSADSDETELVEVLINTRINIMSIHYLLLSIASKQENRKELFEGCVINLIN